MKAPSDKLVLPVDNVQKLLPLGRRRQVLVAVLSNKNAVLDAHAADGVEALQHVPVDEARVPRLGEEVALDVGAAEVAIALVSTIPVGCVRG